MEYTREAQNPNQQNPNHSPYQSNPSPPSPTYHPNQAPVYQPQLQYYSPAANQYNVPPPGVELPMPVTVTVSYVPNQGPNMSWTAAAAGYPPLAPPPYSAGVTLPGAATQVQNNARKKTKTVQSQWCDICQVDCNSKEVFDSHIVGKKHKKNLDRLRGPPPAALAGLLAAPAALLAAPAAPEMALTSPMIGPLETLNEARPSKAARKRKAAASKDVESKKQKVLEGGAAAEAIRTCTVCNVVCNSDTVFKSHMDGQKHATMVKKHNLLIASASAV